MSADRSALPPLSRDDWRRLEPKLDALLDASVERRAALLAELSEGDADRAARLERLVEECERAYELLERPATDRFASLLADTDTSMPEALAGRYRPVRELGRGGMATVYLAHDARHDRDVAVKVVRPELAATLGMDRFLREIAIVAQLHHPHIVPLFDSGEANGTLFYVMPYLEGHSLRERLDRSGPLSIAQALVILRDVCDALTHAHERGIVHRDIKPDNVLLSGRHALVTDFGVARAVSVAAEQGMRTAAGVLLGTPAYMAPEQATGDPHIDHRADVYAFGVLAYELLAGRPPFVGDGPQDIVTAHLVQTPEPLAALRPDVPAPLAELVMTCLAKRPADRWPSADVMLARLNSIAATVGGVDSDERLMVAPRRRRRRHWMGAAALVAITAAGGLWALMRSRGQTASPSSLAVLMFRYGGQPELESLAIGLTTSLIGALGRVPSIDVRSMDAVWPYRDGRTPLDIVARRLDVGWLVGGQVVRLADSVVVSAELTEAATGRLRGRRTAVAAPGNELAVIESLVSAVASMLRERIGDQVRLEGWRAGTHNEAAFDGVNRAYKYVRDADYLMRAGDIAGAFSNLHRADSALASASAAAPTWAEPLIQRAWVARKLAFSLYGIGRSADSVASVVDRGIEHAKAARRVQPNDARAREAHGVLLYARGLLTASGADAEAALDSAARVLTEATDADTSLARGLNVLSSIHYARGNVEQARLSLARAYEADAYAEDAKQILSRLFTYNFVDQDDAEARRWCATYASSQPDDWFGGYCRLQLMAWDPAETPTASAAWQVARASTSVAPEAVRSAVAAQLGMLVAGVLARAGEADSARRVVAAIAERVRHDATMARAPFDLELMELEAGVRVLLHEPDLAVRLLGDYISRRPDRRAVLSRDRRFRDLPIRRLPDAGPSGS